MENSFIKVNNLSVNCYLNPGKRNSSKFSILKNINIDILKNKITILIGESGAGKSIFAKTLSSLLPRNFFVSSGSIMVENKLINSAQLKRLKGNTIFYTPQDAASSLNPVIKIKKQINETSRLSHAQILQIMGALNLNDLDRLLNSYPFELSGGENQRILLTIAIAQKPRLLILDEPTNAMDDTSQECFKLLLKKIQTQFKLTILLITHNLSLFQNISDYIYMLYKGEILKFREPENVFV